MKIRMFVKQQLANGDVMVSEDHELKVGKYNEFYLPVICDSRKEAWIIVTDDSGEETKLHLKR